MTDGPKEISKEDLGRLRAHGVDDFFIERFAERHFGVTRLQLLVESLVVHAHKEIEAHMEHLIASALATGLPTGATENVYKKVCKLSYGWKKDLIGAMFPGSSQAAFIETLNEIRIKIAHIDRKAQHGRQSGVTFRDQTIYSFSGISDLLTRTRQTSQFLWVWTETHFKPLAKKVQHWERAKKLRQILVQMRKERLGEVKKAFKGSSADSLGR